MSSRGHHRKSRSQLAFGLLVAAVVWASASDVSAQSNYDGKPAPMTADKKPPGTEGVGITEKLGTQLDLSQQVVNEKGETVPLSSFFSKGHPVILSLVYYTCPGLCNFHLNGLFEALKEVDWSPGQKFDLLALSFDPKEGADVAGPKRETYLKLLNRPGAESGIHFLTANAATIKAITEQTGFEYKWSEESKEWAHASAAIMLSPEGKITRYLHGIIFQPQDVKLALQESASGKIGSFVDKMVWYCFMYDPKQSKYTLAAFRLVQLGGAAIILILAALLIPQWLRSKQPRV